MYCELGGGRLHRMKCVCVYALIRAQAEAADGATVDAAGGAIVDAAS